MNIEKLFEKELRAYFASHTGISPNKLDDVMVAVYKKWSDKPLAELDGKSPRQYVNGITDPETLVEYAMESVRTGGEPSPLFMEKILATAGCDNALKKVLFSDEKDEVRKTSAELLARIDKLPIDESVELIFDPDVSYELRETVIGLLDKSKELAQRLLPRIGETEGNARFILAELLAGSGVHDDRIFELLIEVLEVNIPYGAQLLSAYDDPRAIELLSEKAETCDYADYIELRNAVEALGGELTLRFNWDNDSSYKKIKGE